MIYFLSGKIDTVLPRWTPPGLQSNILRKLSRFCKTREGRRLLDSVFVIFFIDQKETQSLDLD